MADQPLIDISPENWRIVRDILQRHVPDREVWAFGSRAKWTAKEYSDLDIAVIGDEPLSIGVMAELNEAFHESALPFKVDVVDWATITPSFQKVIGSSKIILTVVNVSTPVLASEYLDDLCSLIADCPHSTPVWTDSGHLVIRNQNIKNGRLDLSEKSFTDDEHYLHRIRRAKPQDGDLIFTREAPMGDVCMVQNGLDCCVGQRQVLLRPNPSKVYPRYLLFAMQSPVVQHQISWNEGTGSTVSNVRIPVLKKLRIPYPELPVQIEIADTLGALDDKIDLLRETNATLEAIAQAIFKSWFVDFDPVRAKAEGREPEGIPPEIAELFPSEFEESELGEIPKGWRSSVLTDNVEVIGGGTPKTSVQDYWGGNIPWFSVVDAPVEGNVFVIDTIKKITELGLRDSSTKLLPEDTTIISARGTVGKVVLVGVPMAMNQSCYGLRGLTCGDYFVYFATRGLVSSLQQRSHGSVFETITRETLASVQIVIASSAVMDAFEQYTGALLQHIKSNLVHMAALTELRDSLLPRLMSGKLQVGATQ